MVTTDPEHEFAFDAGLLCLDFANTVDFYGNGQAVVEHDVHALASYEALVAFGEQAGVINVAQAAALRDRAAKEPAAAAAVLARGLALREATFRATVSRLDGTEPDRRHLVCLNDEYVEAMRHRRLLWGGDGMRTEWTGVGENLASPLWPVAESAVALLIGGETGLVRRCGGEECDWLFLDRTKNHSRRWCSMSGCGNRAKAKRHYEKRRGKTAG